MALPGECANETQTVCMECGTTIDLQVLMQCCRLLHRLFLPRVRSLQP